MRELSPEDVAHCRLLAEVEAGLLEPYFVDVPDGYHTREVVLDEDVECTIWQVGDPNPVLHVTKTKVIPCRIPRYRRELRYRRAR